MKFQLDLKGLIASLSINEMKEKFHQVCEQKGLSYEKACKETYGKTGVCKMDLRTRSSWERIMFLNAPYIQF